MTSDKLYSRLSINRIITKSSSQTIENIPSSLEVSCIAMIEQEKSPCYCPINGEALRDPETNNLTLLEYTPDMIKAYASNFSSPINFNIDHTDGTFAGTITKLSTQEIEGKLALIAEGKIEDQSWINKILQNDFSGISIETTTDLETISNSKLTAISLLNSLSPACPKNKCNTTILSASSQEINIIAWNGPANEKKLLDFSRDKNGDIVVSKIRKFFLVVDSPSGEGGKYNREDFKYPVGSIINGKPDYVLDGLKAALQRSAGEGLDLTSKIRRIIIRRFGVDALFPSLKTKASLLLIENNGVDLMENEDDKIKLEDPPVVETKSTEVEVLKEEPKNEIPVVDTQAAKSIEVFEVITETPKETPEKAVLSKAQMDEVAVALGVESFEAAKDMITELAEIKSRVDDKAGQWQADDLQKQIDCLRKENEELKAFKETTEEKEIMEVLPKGVWQGDIEINGVLVPKVKMIADEIRRGGVGVMLKYVKGAASSSVVASKSSEEEVKTEIKTKGSSESIEIEDESANKQEQIVQAVKNFQKRYMKS
jgi:hypothetical protein